jgi:hypothetical protein
MQYEMHFDVSKPGDLISEREGAFVLMDPASADYLEGAALDYCDDLVGTGFRLQNPNAVRSCGCGTSFEPVERSGSANPSQTADLSGTDDFPETVHAAQGEDVRPGSGGEVRPSMPGDVHFGREREATAAAEV